MAEQQTQSQEVVKANGATVMSAPREYDLATQQRFLPIMPLAVARERRAAIVEAIGGLMTEATPENNMEGDYGVIPGTKRRTLLQPGADKLNNLFGLVPTFHIQKETLDWTGEQHNGEAFFFYEIKCKLWRGNPGDGFMMGEGDGSANSWESKYRYRKLERECPDCGKNAIIKGKAEFGGGWLCWRKKDGCGATFAENDAAITSQIVGEIPNPEIHDVVNTVLKIACKRAKVAATLNATSAHEFFTQDLDDSGNVGGSETYEQLRARKIAEAEEANRKNGGTHTGEPGSKPQPQGQPSQGRGASGRSGATASKPQPDPQQQYINELWARMKNVATIVEVFAELKDKAQLKLGEETGIHFYKSVLGEFDVAKSNEFRKFDKARQCAKEMVLRLARTEAPAKQQAAPPPPPDDNVIEGEFTASDDDLPAGLFDKGNAA